MFVSGVLVVDALAGETGLLAMMNARDRRSPVANWA